MLPVVQRVIRLSLLMKLASLPLDCTSLHFVEVKSLFQPETPKQCLLEP